MIFSFLSPLSHYPAALYTVNPAGHYIHQKLMIIIFFPSVLSLLPPSLCIHAQTCMCVFKVGEKSISSLNLARIDIWLQSYSAFTLDCGFTSHYIHIYTVFKKKKKNQLLPCKPVCCFSLIPLLLVVNDCANETAIEATHTVPSKRVILLIFYSCIGDAWTTRL